MSDEKTGRVTIWEADIGKMVMGQTYKLRGMMVRFFARGNDKETYLSTGKQGRSTQD